MLTRRLTELAPRLAQKSDSVFCLLLLSTLLYPWCRALLGGARSKRGSMTNSEKITGLLKRGTYCILAVLRHDATADVIDVICATKTDKKV